MSKIGSAQFPGISTVKPGESHAGVPPVSIENTRPAISPPIPFNVPDDNSISGNISLFHDVQAIRYDVDSLFNVLSDIVISTSTISLDFQQVTLDLGPNKVPQVALQPDYNLLSEIACQMTCHSFKASNAHDSVVKVLRKLRHYTWDAKAVIALSVFALNNGKPLRLTVAQEASQKQNALELHVFTLAKDGILPTQLVSNDTSNLVKITLELIKGIITLDELFAKRSSYTLKYFATLRNDPRALCTYWAIFSLFACAKQTKREEIQYSWILHKLNVVLVQLKSYLEKIRRVDWLHIIWRLEALQKPSSVGIWQLLKALIYPNNVDKPENIFANGTNELLTLDELIATENLFLFISDLDIKDEIITSITSIHGYKKGSKIVWVPVVKDWTKEMERFKHLKSRMPSWYVVEYYSLIEGYQALQQVWNYRGEPIVVVLDAGANILNQNALHGIDLWGRRAFPFDPVTISTFVSQQWNWFWYAAYKIHPPIRTWVESEEKYVFFYGGTSEWTKQFRDQLVKIENHLLEGLTNTKIEQCNLTTFGEDLQTKFWNSIRYSLLSMTQNVETNNMNLCNIQMLLSMNTPEFGWVIVSNGESVILIGYNNVIVKVLENFEQWEPNISVLGSFGKAIYNYYYVELANQAFRPCMELRLDNIPSSGLIQYTCPEPTCHRKMHIESVTFKCCHGNIGTEDVDNAFSYENGKGPAMIPPSAIKPRGPLIIENFP